MLQDKQKDLNASNKPSKEAEDNNSFEEKLLFFEVPEEGECEDSPFADVIVDLDDEWLSIMATEIIKATESDRKNEEKRRRCFKK